MKQFPLYLLRIAMAASALAFGCMSASAALASSVEIRTEPPALTLRPGEKADLNIMLSTDVELRGAQLKILYDRKVVRIDSVTEGPFFHDWAETHGATASMVFPFTPDNTTGETLVGGIALFGGLPGVGAAGSAPLITVHLTGTAESESTTTLGFGAVILADNDSRKVPEIQVTGAVVSVSPTAASAPPVPTPYVVTQPVTPVYRPAADAPPSTPAEAVVFWLRTHIDVLRIVGGGLLISSFVYVLIVRLAPSSATKTTNPPSATGQDG